MASSVPETEITPETIKILNCTWTKSYHDLKDQNSFSGHISDAVTGQDFYLDPTNYKLAGYYEGTVNFTTETDSSEYSFNERYSYYGYLRYSFSISFGLTNYNSTAVFSPIIIDSIECSDTENNYTFATSNGTGANRTGTLQVWDMFNPDKVYKFNNREFYIIKFRVYTYYNGNASGDPFNIDRISFTMSTSDRTVSQSRLYFSEKDSYYIYNIYNNITQGISDEIAAINSAKVQAHSDATQTQNILQNDSSGFSTGQDAFKSEIDTAQRNADDAVDGAVHSYESDLDTVTEFNWKNFFTAQSSSATFWRDVGEFILDPANLGFISSGLIIVTVIGVFVFALRL